MAGSPRVLVLRAAGINCDEETAAAAALAGGRPERIHVNRLAGGECNLLDYAALIIPGGFSYGDHLGAGKLLAVDLIHRLREPLQRFVADGRPVLGICNGFQVLVRAGLLPGSAAGETPPPAPRQTVTLTRNRNGHYECRWVNLIADPESPCIFTRGLDRLFSLPVGHGEGRLEADDAVLDQLEVRRQVAVRYADVHGAPTQAYPQNPNGSARSVAGLCSSDGTVFGLMPHPDRAYRPQLHPDWLRTRERQEGDGLAIFRNMVRYAQEL
ncbi:MAG TPA: phosphoribosylformylglycinamidine synthase I [Herpetosiphonaceae bacterium]|nr:phosphoribosylformylglycinamidine synthase I [Herpetosiphonaceae bacterium]